VGETKIEWTDRVWNPVTGCTKVSAGCKHCYAERQFPRVYGRDKVEERKRHFTDVVCHPDRLDQPPKWRKPRRVFVCSMGDLFHEDVPWSFICAVFAVMAAARQHTFQVLTKRPRRALGLFRHLHLCDSVAETLGVSARDNGLCSTWMDNEFPGWPLPNVWLGVSCENQAAADERIPLLLQCPATVRFVSCEPLLGPVDVEPALHRGVEERKRHFTDVVCHPDRLDQPPKWVIVGGESGPKARPMHPDWARSIRDQCQAASVPFFFKQWGEWRERIDGDDWTRETCRIDLDGRATMIRVGKKAAGRLLDGKLHEEWPDARD
jgi:protein gp37